jgi:hypothetical protein
MHLEPGHRPPVAALLAIIGLLVAACGGGGAAPPTIPVTIGSADEAAAYVGSRSPLFEGIEPLRDDMIGQAHWWTAEPDGNAWRVVMRVGWGDCMAGCIQEHRWVFAVQADGIIGIAEETGDPLPAEVVAELRGAAPPRTGLAGRATAGPTCPFEAPDIACSPASVGDVVLVVRPADGGAEIARVRTDGAGFFRVSLAPGTYRLEAPEVEGYLGTPAAEAFTVNEGSETVLDPAWDTGIR